MIIGCDRRKGFCLDCKENCFHAGKIISDCPKSHCDLPYAQRCDCENCEFMQEIYKKGRKKNG